jgi:[ribosomal protein S5]-alanine N-acetyltransferase
MEIAKTERLLLKYMDSSDIPELVDLWTDPVAMEHMGGPRDREFLLDEFGKTAKNPRAERFDLWPVIELASGTLVGHCGLLPKEVEGKDEIELVYVIAARFWGKGFATEIGRALTRYAREILGLMRLISLIEPGNTASERVAAKIGMRLEREVVRPSGQLRLFYTLNFI